MADFQHLSCKTASWRQVICIKSRRCLLAGYCNVVSHWNPITWWTDILDVPERINQLRWWCIKYELRTYWTTAASFQRVARWNRVDQMSRWCFLITFIHSSRWVLPMKPASHGLPSKQRSGATYRNACVNIRSHWWIPSPFGDPWTLLRTSNDGQNWKNVFPFSFRSISFLSIDKHIERSYPLAAMSRRYLHHLQHCLISIVGLLASF